VKRVGEHDPKRKMSVAGRGYGIAAVQGEREGEELQTRRLGSISGIGVLSGRLVIED